VEHQRQQQPHRADHRQIELDGVQRARADAETPCYTAARFVCHLNSADPMQPLNRKHIQYLRALAHNLKPVVMVGNKGMTQAVIEETDRALTHHELIKVKLAGADHEQRAALAESLCRQTDAVQVNLIGRIVTLYRDNPDQQRIDLSRS
jgi:RNA-binding protein